MKEALWDIMIMYLTGNYDEASETLLVITNVRSFWCRKGIGSVRFVKGCRLSYHQSTAQETGTEVAS